ALGADLGAPAPRGRRRVRGRDSGPAEVQLGRLPGALLGAAGQARRAEGALRELSLLPARRRPLARDRLGGMEPPRAGTGRRCVPRRAAQSSRVVRGALDPAARPPPRATAPATQVAQRARPRDRPASGRLLRRLRRGTRPRARPDPRPDPRMGAAARALARPEALRGDRMTTLLRELIEIPDRVHRDDFVLRLTEGVRREEETLRHYVVTPQLAECFD